MHATSPEEANSSERRVVFDDGASTIVESWGERGPVVLCVHGITSSRRSWTRFAERFSQTRRVYAYDQRGHGDSARVHGPMTLERSVADLRAVVAAIGEPVSLLVGHSWGGAVAILAAREVVPGRTVAIDPMIHVAPHTFDSEYVDDLRPLFGTEGEQREAGIRAMYAGAHAADIEGKVHAMSSMSIDAVKRLGRGNDVDGGAWDLRGALVDYPVPLLILRAGIESVVSDRDLADVLATGGNNVRSMEFAGEGHNLQRTAFEAFIAVVAAYAERAA